MIITIVAILVSLGIGTGLFFAIDYPNWSMVWTIPLFALLYFILIIFVFLVFVAAFGGIYQILNRPAKDKPNRFGMFILEQTSFILIRLLNAHPHFSGWGKLPSRKQRFLLVSNHLSGFDHLGIISILAGRRIICVSKRQNEDIFAAGGWLRFAGFPAIDQKDILQGQKVVEHTSNLIQENVCSVAIAPEGTRNKDFPEPLLLPFKPGSFQIAVQAKAPIVVIAIQNTNAVLQRFPRFTNLYFDCVAVLEYEDYKDMSLNEIATYCHDRILERITKKESRFYHLKQKRKEEKREQKRK